MCLCRSCERVCEHEVRRDSGDWQYASFQVQQVYGKPLATYVAHMLHICRDICCTYCRNEDFSLNKTLLKKMVRPRPIIREPLRVTCCHCIHVSHTLGDIA